MHQVTSDQPHPSLPGADSHPEPAPEHATVHPSLADTNGEAGDEFDALLEDDWLAADSFAPQPAAIHAGGTAGLPRNLPATIEPKPQGRHKRAQRRSEPVRPKAVRSGGSSFARFMVVGTLGVFGLVLVLAAVAALTQPKAEQTVASRAPARPALAATTPAPTAAPQDSLVALAASGSRTVLRGLESAARDARQAIKKERTRRNRAAGAKLRAKARARERAAARRRADARRRGAGSRPVVRRSAPAPTPAPAPRPSPAPVAPAPAPRPTPSAPVCDLGPC